MSGNKEALRAAKEMDRMTQRDAEAAMRDRRVLDVSTPLQMAMVFSDHIMPEHLEYFIEKHITKIVYVNPLTVDVWREENDPMIAKLKSTPVVDGTVPYLYRAQVEFGIHPFTAAFFALAYTLERARRDDLEQRNIQVHLIKGDLSDSIFRHTNIDIIAFMAKILKEKPVSFRVSIPTL